MSTKKKPKQHGNNVRHRKKEPGISRGTVRGKVQVSGRKTGHRGKQSNHAGNSDQRNPRHDPKHDPAPDRSDHSLGDSNHRITGSHHNLVGNQLRSKINQAQNLLESLARQHLIGRNNIFQVDDSIRAFGCYTIVKTANSYNIYRGSTLAFSPANTRIAIAWCVADKYNHFALLRDIEISSAELERLENDIDHYRGFIKLNQDNDRNEIILHRLHTTILRQKYIKNRLDKCIDVAKYMQQKGFDNETARIGLKHTGTKKS